MPAVTLHVSGVVSCDEFQRTCSLVRSISELYPSLFKFYVSSAQDLSHWTVLLQQTKSDLKSRGCMHTAEIEAHRSSPLVWSSRSDEDPQLSYQGGYHSTKVFIQSHISFNFAISRHPGMQPDAYYAVWIPLVTIANYLIYFGGWYGFLIVTIGCLVIYFIQQKSELTDWYGGPVPAAMLVAHLLSFKRIRQKMAKYRELKLSSAKLGSQAPDGPLYTTDGNRLMLSDIISASRPLVLNFGSCT
jgi:hypothetical protein